MKKLALLLLLPAIFAVMGCQNDTTETTTVPETVYHTVSFESNSETTIESQTVESGKTATKPASPTKTGYTFSAWYDGENAFDFSTPITKDTTLTAKWTANTYTVTLSNNGEESQVSVTFGENIGDLESVPAMENSSFGGFYTEEYAKGEKFIGADGKGCKAYEIASDTTLYAAWGYRISYENLRERENPNPEIYTGEEDIALLDLENITGFAFAGWYDAETDGNKVETIAKGEYGAKTLYARWTEVSYTVKHFLQNVNDDEYTEAESEKETFPGKIGDSTEATAKTFTGFTAKTIEQKTIEMEGTVVNVYYDRNVYEVTFDVKEDGNPVESQHVRYGGNAKIPDNPGKYPFDLASWNTSSDDGTTLSLFDFDTKIEAPTKLYAKYQVNCTIEDVQKKVKAMGKRGTVVLTGLAYIKTPGNTAKNLWEGFQQVKGAIAHGIINYCVDLDLSEWGMYWSNYFNRWTGGIPTMGVNKDESAFIGQPNLASIILPKTLEVLKYDDSDRAGAFLNCENLERVTIPESVTEIQKYFCRNCEKLTEIIFTGTIEQWNAITKAENWNGSVPATEVVCSDGTVPLR